MDDSACNDVLNDRIGDGLLGEFIDTHSFPDCRHGEGKGQARLCAHDGGHLAFG